MSGYFDNDRADVREEIRGTFALGLDVGCGQGLVGRALLKDGVVGEFDGIEIVDTEAKVAEGHYRRVWTGTVESCLSDPAFLGRYELILCADVLEHLVDPWTALRGLADHLAPGGTLVISIPNVRFAPVMINLLRGRFDYTDQGVLDRTHLRFFTRRSLSLLLERADLVAETVIAKKSAKRFRGVLARALGDFGSAQFIVIAHRPSSG